MESRRKLGPILKELFVWLLTLLLAFVFFATGAAKLTDGGGWTARFNHWGFPVWFRIFIGALEVLSALLLIVPRLATVGALLVGVIMLGGIGTHLVNHEPREVFHEVGPLLFAFIIFLFRRSRIWSSPLNKPPQNPVHPGGSADPSALPPHAETAAPNHASFIQRMGRQPLKYL